MSEQKGEFLEDRCLDEMLARARWPEADSAALDQLRRVYLREHFWIKARLSTKLVAAAVIVLAIAGWAMMKSPPAPQVQVAVKAPAAPTPRVEPPIETRVEPRVESREPTLAERVMLLSAKARYAPPRSGQPITRRPVEPPREQFDGQVVKDGLALYLRSLDRPTHEDRAMAELRDHAAVGALFARLHDPRVSARLAAARALGLIDGPVITKKLAEMVADGVNQREALAALVSSRGKEAMQFVESAKNDRRLGPQISAIESDLKAHS